MTWSDDSCTHNTFTIRFGPLLPIIKWLRGLACVYFKTCNLLSVYETIFFQSQIHTHRCGCWRILPTRLRTEHPMQISVALSLVPLLLDSLCGHVCRSSPRHFLRMGSIFRNVGGFTEMRLSMNCRRIWNFTQYSPNLVWVNPIYLLKFPVLHSAILTFLVTFLVCRSVIHLVQYQFWGMPFFINTVYLCPTCNFEEYNVAK